MDHKAEYPDGSGRAEKAAMLDDPAVRHKVLEYARFLFDRLLTWEELLEQLAEPWEWVADEWVDLWESLPPEARLVAALEGKKRYNAAADSRD